MKTVFRYSFLLLCAALVCVGCRHRNNPIPPVEAPSWQVEENLQGATLWHVADDAVDITSRMYMIVSLGDSVTEVDKLSAWSGDECVSVVQPIHTPDGWLFYMIINRPQYAQEITLAYYSASYGKVAYWSDLFLFQQDAVIGSADDPYCLLPDMRSSYPMYSVIQCSLPNTIRPAQGDEMAVFVDNHCRVVIDPLVKNGMNNLDYMFRLPLNQTKETAEIRYFCRETGKIYIASNILALAGSTLQLSEIPFQ